MKIKVTVVLYSLELEFVFELEFLYSVLYSILSEYTFDIRQQNDQLTVHWEFYNISLSPSVKNSTNEF